ncbi:hypothetical protein PFICI_07940 [Pestalotiopsis fici W106-1]|uniref:Serine hydrolase domain-containing protein n=1 Tax=Pestalotiopsis fici (strain W106-1 / CGMCC3.15140) TaxID=1229662 RepID=W3X5E4_PESFW|nr:uncharacterized protein PFICI_07940 [Pestalotiopsis fici W106-1]ETS80411.1 hypothetical protein PFICI_07940 [Pestalotiopsis fici W106-1]
MSVKHKKVLLCFHGTGSKGAIFNVQLARICFLLGSEFDFIFLDGPLECAAGPGVLPFFAKQEPYYCWFAGSGTTIDESMTSIIASVEKSIAGWKAANLDAEAEIVGAIGFSEGALTLSLLLWMQQQNLVPSLPRLSFAVMSCCFFPVEASKWLTAKANAQGESQAYINVPTIHVHGNRDFCLGRARRLVRSHYKSENATVLMTEAAHHLPTKKDEVDNVVDHILRLSKATAI